MFDDRRCVMEDRYPLKERRKFKRIMHRHVLMYRTAAISSASKAANGIMLDVSPAGIAFLTRHKIPGSALISNRFVLIDDLAAQPRDRFRAIQAQGRVRYRLKGQEGMFRVGLRFTRLSGADRRYIRTFQNRSRAKDKTGF
jgi:c-di-GMP-binding flagellar brake protein YcgR